MRWLALLIITIGSLAFIPEIEETTLTQPQVIVRTKSVAPAKISAFISPANDERGPAEDRTPKAAEELARLKTCYDVDCGYSRRYPMDYEYAVGRDIKKVLSSFAMQVANDGLKSGAIAAIAREFLANDDGHVKEAALHLMATQSASEENLQALLEHVVAGIDATLIEHAMLELRRYSREDHLKMIHVALADAMVTGTPFVSEAVSQNIGLFINHDSLAFFRALTRQISPDSRVSDHLRASLEDFSKRQSGG